MMFADPSRMTEDIEVWQQKDSVKKFCRNFDHPSSWLQMGMIFFGCERSSDYVLIESLQFKAFCPQIDGYLTQSVLQVGIAPCIALQVGTAPNQSLMLS